MGTRIGVKICGLAFRISTLQQEFAANVLITLTTIINIWQGVIKKTGEILGGQLKQPNKYLAVEINWREGRRDWLLE